MADQLKQVTWKVVVKNGHRHKVRAEDSALRGYETMSMGNQFLTVCGNEVYLVFWVNRCHCLLTTICGGILRVAVN